MIKLYFQDHWINALQTLELSLDEVVHIRYDYKYFSIKLSRVGYFSFSVIINFSDCRSVLSRAELDALPLDNNLKSDVERGKVITMTHKYVHMHIMLVLAVAKIFVFISPCCVILNNSVISDCIYIFSWWVKIGTCSNSSY